MKTIIKLTLLLSLISFVSCASADKYKAFDINTNLLMAEVISEDSKTPESQAFWDIIYSSADLSYNGFKLNAKKKDFVEKGLDPYYYYSAKNSLKDTYKTLTKGNFSIPEMEGVDLIKLYIDTFNKQKEEFYTGK